MSQGIAGVLRLTMISHGMTDAMAAARFPADEPLNTLGRRQAEEVGPLDTAGRQFCAPERRTRQTAALLGLRATVESRLRELDCGRWRGQLAQDLDLDTWLTDTTRAPHGGESIVDLIERVAGWLGSLTESTVAVTHPAVVRSAILVALDAPPKSFWRIDIPPLSRTVMHCRGGNWTLRP